jgi:hypothetical protein
MVRLPWESDVGMPDGVGICLSGGGLRSASFSMGVLQALQEKRGLLYGDRSADYLAVVSGGSYIAAAAFLSAAASDASRPPLADGSSESAHVVSHGRYLVEDGWIQAPWRFVWRVIVGVVASALLFAWTAFMAGDVASVLDYYVGWIPANTTLQWIGFAAYLAGLVSLGASALTDITSQRWVLILGGFVDVVIGASSFVERVRGTDWLAEPSWVWSRPIILALIIALYLAAVVLPFVAKGVARPLVLAFGRNAPRACLVVGTCWAVAAVDPHLAAILDESAEVSPWHVLLVFGPLVGGLAASYVHDVVSLHRPYRDLTSRCFGIRRAGSTVARVRPPSSAKLSDLAPSGEPKARQPRLLICATANVQGGPSRDDRRRESESFVLSHDYCGLPGRPDVFFATSKLEFARARASVLGRKLEPEVSLLGAVAMTGAAFAPTMGTMTSPALRPLIAFANVRLGVWLPNPLSPDRRMVVDMRPARPPRAQAHLRNEHGLLGPGGSAVISEILGVHTRTAKRIYVTDGGHYENLGLITLLRARCHTIWCIDAYSNRKRLYRQLDRVIELAYDELGVTITIPTERFALQEGSRHLAKHAFAVGEIRYDDHSPLGRLIVIKSALTAASPRHLHEYRRKDPRFPYHCTLKQWYGETRFDSYRQLGYFHACEACASA